MLTVSLENITTVRNLVEQNMVVIFLDKITVIIQDCKKNNALELFAQLLSIFIDLCNKIILYVIRKKGNTEYDVMFVW